MVWMCLWWALVGARYYNHATFCFGSLDVGDAVAIDWDAGGGGGMTKLS